MNKIPTLFLRDDNDRRYVTDQPNPDCQWVFDGEGEPTRKYDGTCVMFDGARWWARREVKPGKKPPANYVPVTTDETTGKTMGWEPIEQSAFAKYHAEAMERSDPLGWPAGTYELVGPKVNGNPERLERHEVWSHDRAEEMWVHEPTYEFIREAVLSAHAIDGCEGLVWHHPDGRMAKIKARDFRPAPEVPDATG